MAYEGLTLAAWSFGLAGAAYTAFALRLVILGYWRPPYNRPEAAVLAAVAGWGLWGWLGLAAVLSTQIRFLWAANVADVLRYGCWYAFLLMLFRGNRGEALPRGAKRLVPVALVLVAYGVLANGLAMLGIRTLVDSARLILLDSMALPVFALILLEQVYRNLPEDSRWNAKPLCLGLAGAFLFDLYLYSQAVLFNRVDADALSIRGAMHALVAPLLFLSVRRRRDWIAKIRVSRKAAFHSATLLLAGLYLIFISAVGYYVRYFGGDWGRALQLGLVFGALVVLMVLALSGSMRARLRVFVGKHFFRYRYDYREEWLRFTTTLSTKNAPQEMGQQIVRGLADMLDSPGGGLWTKSLSETSFAHVGRWNIAHAAEKEPANSPLCHFLATSGWVINLEEYRSYPGRYGGLALPDWLQAIPQAWLVVPLIVGDELIGFVVLQSARARMDVNWEVNDLLKTAGRQAASFLAQMQATEALLEARKFDAFNRMSAFVVHDLKNIVTQLSLMMKNAKRLHANPEFQQDMLMTVENALDRMRQMMLQLREGATPPGKTHGVDLGALVKRVGAQAAERGRQLDADIIDWISTRGHEERLERIVGHVVQNAFDATDASGKVWLVLERRSGQACIEVGDTGQGMTQEFIRDRLFKPFQTTKQAGMGIGAYESFQYVQELGGKIQVESEVGKGTLVTILLPLFETQRESDLHSLEMS